MSADGERLKASLHRLDAILEHFHYDVFEAALAMDPDQKIKVEFLMNSGGNVDRLQAPLEPAVKPIVFTRAAAK